MRVLWTARRSNQSILKEINHECSLGGLIPKVTFQHFGHLMQRPDSMDNTLLFRKTEGKRRRGRRRIRWLDSLTDSMDMMTVIWETVEERGAWYATGHGAAELDTT